MGAAKEAMGGGEAPPHDPAEAEAAINAEADKAGAAGNSDLMAKLKAAATNKKIQGAFMDVRCRCGPQILTTLLDGVMPSQVKNNGVSAAMKYKDDAECVCRCPLLRRRRRRDESHATPIDARRRHVSPRRVTGILKDVFMS